MDFARRGANMFCTNCGMPAEPGASFCTKCGCRISRPQTCCSSSGSSPRITIPEEWPDSFAKLKDEEVVLPGQPLPEAEIEWLNINHSSHRYRIRSLPRFHAKILVSNQRLCFLNSKNNNPVSEEVVFLPLKESDRSFPRRGGRVPLSPFWVLKPSANQELHKQLMNNPTAFSKAPGFWWVHGSYGWSWVSEITPHGGSELDFTLNRVVAISKWGPGRDTPSSYLEGTARLRMQKGDADTLKRCIVDGWPDLISLDKKYNVKPDLESAFGKEYIQKLPEKPETTTHVAYFYVFWTSIVLAIALGLLLGMDASPAATILVSLGISLVTIRFLGRLRSRPKQGSK
jgi:hypothetical protein